MSNSSDRYLKGGVFQNRYRLTGTLTTISPLHIGTGIESDTRYQGSKANGEPFLVSTIMKDVNGKPMIPGSSLKGVLRHWLFDILAGVGSEWAEDRDYNTPDLTELDQASQAQKVLREFSWLERLFGTPFHEGKIEVWDAVCTTPEMEAPDSLLQWEKKSLTHIDTSVAINPATGTALEHLLYKTELVPPGVTFDITVTGQNLSELEVGILLFGLQGFNSEIYPLVVGARGGRGYGRMSFKINQMQKLDKNDLPSWITSQLQTADETAAGYFNLPTVSEEEQTALIAKAKTAFIKSLGGA